MDDLSESSISEFLSSSYAVSSSNQAFRRLHELMFVQIPMALCVGDNGLSRVDRNEGVCTWEQYNTEYSANLEALIVFMFKEQLEYLTKQEDQDNSSHCDNSSEVSGDVQKKRGGRPKNKKTFCPIGHHKYKHEVWLRREETSNWFGWYDAAVQSISCKNKEHLDEMRNGISASVPQDSQGQERFGQQEEVDPQESLAYSKQMEMEAEMYRRRQESKNVNKRAKPSDNRLSVGTTSSGGADSCSISSSSLQDDSTEKAELTTEEQLRQIFMNNKENAVQIAEQLIREEKHVEI
jgi:hypothetical protein